MNVDRVTISGADDSVDPVELEKLQIEYPFVEWGILISRSRTGSPRYPTYKWIWRLPGMLSIAHHLCGSICREFITYPSTMILNLVSDNWRRTQLNHSFRDYISTSKDIEEVAEVATLLPPNKAIIFAYNKTNSTALDPFMRGKVPHNIHFLYDSSGGRGSEIKDFDYPFKTYTGYAGGIDANNIERVLERLQTMRDPSDVWIDMESGVRTNDKFDLDKVRQVLHLSAPYINEQI